ncbi:hypothetical protein GCM10011495_36560 [Hymenobacter frigidus]|uniref:Uncharacterized protein n=1 Tax=Hymenobacter frigidus TaxID=1524095 RepID=A0ABQ2AEX1_9BACT|nr:hypothetical protein GCM10011495_36560 [Hymenobacter frigidus]
MVREAGLSDSSVPGFGPGGRGTGPNRLGGFKKGLGRRDTSGLTDDDYTSGAASYCAAFKETVGKVGAGGALRFGRAPQRRAKTPECKLYSSRIGLRKKSAKSTKLV